LSDHTRPWQFEHPQQMVTAYTIDITGPHDFVMISTPLMT
jgi:hypothetical protein